MMGSMRRRRVLALRNGWSRLGREETALSGDGTSPPPSVAPPISGWGGGRGKGGRKGEVGAEDSFGKHVRSEDWAAGVSWIAVSLVVELRHKET